MSDKPILFQSDMVRALLDGRKTQTRRIVKPQPQRYDNNIPGLTSGCHGYTWNGRKYLVMDHGHSGILDSIKQYCPYGQPGDLLWVREAWCELQGDVYYKADPFYPEKIDKYRQEKWKWKPSIHMPRKYSRLTLKITNVRVERVQEITNDDAKAEGTPYACPHRHGKEGIEYEYPDELIKDPYAAKHNTGINDCWICAFKNLWQSINGIKSWNENPWVWVIEFEVIKQNIDKVLNNEREG